MSGWTRGSLFAALRAAGVASILGWVLVLGTGPALADPPPGDPGVVAGPGAGQDPTPFTGAAPFGPPRLVPATRPAAAKISDLALRMSASCWSVGAFCTPNSVRPKESR